jgi:hypothetical protein
MRAMTEIEDMRVADVARGPAHERLEVFVGRWINEGAMIAPDGGDVRVVTSDVYEWGPGRVFLVHTAHGLIGSTGVGGIEIIGVDPSSGGYRCEFFDSLGNVSTQALIERDGVWTWVGDGTRCTLMMSDDGLEMVAHHERQVESRGWEPAMDVTLRRTT